MKITESGYIKLHRSILSNPLANEDRPRTKLEAWIDLLMAAWYSEEPGKVMVGNKSLIFHRGEVYASLRYLAESWQWSKNKVDGFLTYLQNEDMIQKRTDKGTGRTVITICKYDDYNPKGEIEGQPTGRKKDSSGTASGQHRDSSGTNNKKVKKVKKEEEGKEGEESAQVRDPQQEKEPSQKQKKEKKPPDCARPPFSDRFYEVWEKLLTMPKWKKKNQTALDMSLKKLARYDECFAIELVENAISGDYQGVVFGDTDVKYQDYQNKKNGKNAQRSITASSPEPGRAFGSL